MSTENLNTAHEALILMTGLETIDVEKLITDHSDLIMETEIEAINTKKPYYIQFYDGIAAIGPGINRARRVELKTGTVPEDAYIAINTNSLQLVTIVRDKIVKKNLIYIPESLDALGIEQLIKNTAEQKIDIWDFLDKTADFLGSVGDVMGGLYGIPIRLIEERNELAQERQRQREED